MRRRCVWYGKCVVRSGTQGMKWGHRYHQDYITKPTRSGMVGEVHFNKDVDHDKRLTDSEQEKREKKQERFRDKIKNKFSRKLDPAFDNYTKIKYNAKQDKIMSNEEEMNAFKNKNIFEHIDNKKDLIEAAAKYSYLYGRSPHNTNSDYYRGQTGKIDENKIYKSLNKKERNKINEIMVSERDRGERDRSESSNHDNRNKEKAMQLSDKLSDLEAEMAEIDMFSPKDQKAIQSEYKRTMNQYKKLTGEAPKNTNNKLNDPSLNKALDLWKKSRTAKTGEESDRYERQFDKYLGDKNFQKALNNLSPEEQKEYDKMFKPFYGEDEKKETR